MNRFNTYRFLAILTMPVTCLLASASPVTIDKALEIAKRTIPESTTCNYYQLYKDSVCDSWSIFVDLHPTQNWGHEAYCIKIPKHLSDDQIDHYVPEYEVMNFIPSGNNEILEINVDILSEYNESLMVKKASIVDQQNRSVSPDPSNIYAVIISGGINKYSNYARYWNDCAYIYQTLRNKYNVPKAQIIPLMADGNDPAPDTPGPNYFGKESYISQHLDLDLDGIDDIELAATKQNIIDVFTDLTNQLKKDDLLYIYVIDHGYLRPVETGCIIELRSSIELWNEEYITDFEIANLLTPLLSKGISVSAVFGQCYSGGFVNVLSDIGCVVASACAADEVSWGSDRGGYDEFVYLWTTAMNSENGIDKYQDRVDTNYDNYISMKEAFDYAQKNDAQDETPVYSSNPAYWGDLIAFDYMPSSVNLVIRDSNYDLGFEPSSTELSWNSPDIKIDDEASQNTESSNSDETNSITVDIRNLGLEDYVQGKYLNLYWGIPSTDYSCADWCGNNSLPNSSFSSGGRLYTVELPYIMQGETISISNSVTIPNPIKQIFNFKNIKEKSNFCLLAQISNNPLQSKYNPYDPNYAIANNNDVAACNLVKITKSDFNKIVPILMRNASSLSRTVAYEFKPASEQDEEFFNSAQVLVGLGTNLFSAWTKGGRSSEGVSTKTLSNSSPLTFYASGSRISNIVLNEEFSEFAIISFNLLNNNNSGKTFKLNLIERNESDDSIIGVLTFEITLPAVNSTAGSIKVTDKDESYVLEAYDSDDVVSYSWTDNQGDVISDSCSVEVTPTKDDNVYRLLCVDRHGNMAVENISLEPKLAIKTLIYDKNSNTLRGSVTKSVAQNNYKIHVSGIPSSDKGKTYDITSNTEEFNIVLNDIQSKIISVSLISGDEIIETKKITTN